MTLKEYFANREGLCVLSSAGRSGQVTTAIYSAPRMMDNGTVAFIMRERLTYSNIRENPHAACMFIEKGGGLEGLRLYVTMLEEKNDPELISRMTRRHLSAEEDAAKGPKHLVIFRVDKILPLVGDRDISVSVG